MSSETKKMKQSTEPQNMFLRFRPLHRVLISLLIAGITYLLIRNSGLNTLQIPMVLWDTFSFSMLITSWIVILFRPPVQIRKWARREDGSKAFVFLLVLVMSFASIISVIALISSNRVRESSPILYVTLSVLSILLSWALVHTIFTFHYAHFYYEDDDDPNSSADTGGLEFPGKDKEPDYRDFAYFSFVIGMTFQVSDVQVTHRKMRRLVLTHGLLSFALNTFVVALMINLIAGLKG